MNFWHIISNLGTHNLASFEAKRVRLVNRLCLVLAIISFTFIAPWIAQKNNFMVMSNISLIFLYSLAIFLNFKKFYNSATAILIFTTSTGVFVISGMIGSNSPLHYGLTSFSAFSIILFDRKEKLKIILGILYPLILLFILIYKDFEIFPNIIGQKTNLLHTFDYIINFGIIMTTILCFYNYYISAEDKFRLLYEQHLRAQDQLHEEKARSLVSSKMAALGEMAGGIAHEINNPLFVIKAVTQTLIKDIGSKNLRPEEVIEKCRIIENTSSRISNIIRSLKTISGSSENCPISSHNVKDLIEDTLVLCQHRFYIANLPLNVIYETSNTNIRVRPVDFVQILVNLLNNSYDAIQDVENPQVNLRVRSEDQFIIVNVEDNGIGISDEIQHKIYDAFYTTKSPDKGTGLGLSLSKKLAQNNEGTISFTSSPGKTTFSLKFYQ